MVEPMRISNPLESLLVSGNVQSGSNFWIRDCWFLRYKEYRFAIKAHLNLLVVAAHMHMVGVW